MRTTYSTDIGGVSPVLRRRQEEDEYEYASYKHGAETGEPEAHLETGVLYQSLGEAAGESEAGSTLGFVVPLCVAGSEVPCGRDAKGKQGEKCGSMYVNKPCHHGGGGHGGTPQAKKSCPPGYWKIPVVETCIRFEWPSGPSPAPSYGPYPEGPVPVGG